MSKVQTAPFRRKKERTVTDGEIAAAAGQATEFLVAKARLASLPAGKMVIRKSKNSFASFTPIQCGQRSITGIINVRL